MKLLVSTVILTLAWYAVSNVVASAVTWAAAAWLGRRDLADRRPSPELLFAVRLFPVAISAFIALVLFLPVHLTQESREGSESFGLSLNLLALLSMALFGASAVRIAGALNASRRMRRTWNQQRAADAPNVVEDCDLPNMSLAGIVRTTVVVGRPVREALTSDELEVALAHELAHRRSWDNVKRFAMFAAPDLFGRTRVARRLEELWGADVECLADAQAVDGDAGRAANLASALVKVARLADAEPPCAHLPIWSTFHHQSILEMRVHRLVGKAPVAQDPSLLVPAMALALTVMTLWTAVVADIPRILHFISEILVQRLP